MKDKFKRQGSQRKEVKESWRRPKGVQSKQRKEKKGHPRKPKIGMKKPEEERGLHPSGYKEKLVHNKKDLKEIDEEKEAIKIASNVGKRKRQKIEKEAREKEIKILNEKFGGIKND